MYGLCSINTHFTSDGSGRDFIILGDKERRNGKMSEHARPFRTACLDRECHPRKRPTGPRPPSNERVRQLNQGLWQCSGQWATEAKSSRSLPHSPGSSLKLKRSASDPLGKVGTYSDSMQAWSDARLPDLSKSKGRQHDWLRCTTQSFSGGSSPRRLGPDLAESSFMGQTLSSTASAAMFLDTRKAHGYMEPGILRRPGAFSKIPCGWAGTTVDRPIGTREDRFLSVRQPHELANEECMRSTTREPRFVAPEASHCVDVRRSN